MSEHDHHENDEGAERRPSHSLTHVLSQVYDTPWAITEPMLNVINDVVLMRLRGERFTRDELDERIGAAARRGEQSRAGAVAVIPIQGVIVPKATLFTDISGGTSLTRFQGMFREAIADPEVGSIMLDIDSPGGSVALLEETATLIRSFRGKGKPIVAFANTMVASAAYYLAAQADEVVGTPSAMIGSVGTIAMHFDYSKAIEDDGVKVTIVRAGEHKFEGNPYEPLGDGALASMQALVDEYYSRFIRDVAKGRGVDTADVEAKYGQGRMLTVQDAVKAGMADREDTFGNTVARLARGQVASTTARAEDTNPPIRAAETAADEVAEDREPGEPELREVDGAFALLGRQAVRDAFAPAATDEEGGQ